MFLKKKGMLSSFTFISMKLLKLGKLLEKRLLDKNRTGFSIASNSELTLALETVRSSLLHCVAIPKETDRDQIHTISISHIQNK